MKASALTLIALLVVVATWQFAQRRAHEHRLSELQAQLDRRTNDTFLEAKPSLLSARTSNLKVSSKSPSSPEPSTPAPGKRTIAESWVRFGDTLGSSTRRLMELRDQLPEDERVPFSNILELVGSLNKLRITDPNLMTELVQEADVAMRMYIDTMTGIMSGMTPEKAKSLSNGECDPSLHDFGVGYVMSALELNESEREHLTNALSDSEKLDEALKNYLTEGQFRLLIELTRGQRYDELGEKEREEPLDLLRDMKSIF